MNRLEQLGQINTWPLESEQAEMIQAFPHLLAIAEAAREYLAMVHFEQGICECIQCQPALPLRTALAPLLEKVEEIMKRDPEYKLCPDCGQPMLPKGEVKKPNEYDHAQGCPRDLAVAKQVKPDNECWICGLPKGQPPACPGHYPMEQE